MLNDPIADILKQVFMSSGYDFEFDDATKQIRQQIGRELLTERNLFNHTSGDNFVREDIISEVCQLEEP